MFGPREPFTRVFSWIVYMETFVHDARASIAGNQLVNNCFSQLYLSLSILEWIKQSARYSDKTYENFLVHLRTSFIEVGIFRAQNRPTSSLVDLIVNGAISQIRSCQQAWHVWIIHDASISQTVYFKSIDLLALAVSRVGVVFDPS